MTLDTSYEKRLQKTAMKAEMLDVDTEYELAVAWPTSCLLKYYFLQPIFQYLYFLLEVLLKRSLVLIKSTKEDLLKYRNKIFQ